MNTIRSRLFVIYSSLLIALIAVFFAAYYATSYSELSKNAEENLKTQAVYLSALLDEKIRAMDEVAIRIITSNTLRRSFYGMLDRPSGENTIHGIRIITEQVYSAAGPAFPFI